MSSAGGFVLLYRRLWDHSAFRGRVEAAVFAWMICAAAWQRVEVRYKGRLLRLERGQLAVSTRDLAAAWEWSEAKVRRYLARLESNAMIGAHSDAGVNVITVCNYDKFQAWPWTGDAPSDARRDALATQQRRTADAQNNERNPGNKRNREGDDNRVRAPARGEWDDEEMPPGISALRSMIFPVSSRFSLAEFAAECPARSGVTAAHVSRVRDGKSVPDHVRQTVLATALRLARGGNIA